MQRRAGMGNDDIALLEPIIDLKARIGRKPDTNAPHFDGPIAHYPHACPIRRMKNCGTGNGDTTALARIYCGLGEHADPKRWVPCNRQPRPAELCYPVNLGRHKPDMSDQFAAVFELDSGHLLGFEFRYFCARQVSFNFDFIVDDDPEQWPAA